MSVVTWAVDRCFHQIVLEQVVTVGLYEWADELLDLSL